MHFTTMPTQAARPEASIIRDANAAEKPPNGRPAAPWERCRYVSRETRDRQGASRGARPAAIDLRETRGRAASRDATRPPWSIRDARLRRLRAANRRAASPRACHAGDPAFRLAPRPPCGVGGTLVAERRPPAATRLVASPRACHGGDPCFPSRAARCFTWNTWLAWRPAPTMAGELPMSARSSPLPLR
jgi:hypothetical protein